MGWLENFVSETKFFAIVGATPFEQERLMKIVIAAVAIAALVASPAFAQKPRRHVSHHAHIYYQAAPSYDYNGGDTAASLDE
jgi:hypothetical protein